MRTAARFNACAAASPPKPPPMITTWGASGIRILVLGEEPAAWELVVYTSQMPQPEVIEREPRGSVRRPVRSTAPTACSLSVTVRDGKIVEIDGGAREPRHARVHLRQGAAVRRARLRRRPPALSRRCARARRDTADVHARRRGTRRSSSIASADDECRRRTGAPRRSCRSATADRTACSRRTASTRCSSAARRVAARAHGVRGADRRRQPALYGKMPSVTYQDYPQRD